MIYDTNENPLTSAHLAMFLAGSLTPRIRIECRANYFLRSESAAHLSVEARRVGDADWTDIETTPVDLTVWNATRQNFDIRLTSVGGMTGTDVFDLTVSL